MKEVLRSVGRSGSFASASVMSRSKPAVVVVRPTGSDTRACCGEVTTAVTVASGTRTFNTVLRTEGAKQMNAVLENNPQDAGVPAPPADDPSKADEQKEAETEKENGDDGDDDDDDDAGDGSDRAE